MPYKYPDATILVFCKAPIAGQVKTRLMPDLSSQQAVEIHIELTNRILSLLSKNQLSPIQLWCSPNINHSFFQQCETNYQLSLHTQQGDDLGERMHHAITSALETSAAVILMGCDCPSFESNDLEFAITALQAENDIVIAPAEDGGYVMIGMTQAQPQLFLNLTWGHDQVFKNTRQRMSELDLKCIETCMHWDIDTADDLQRYQSLK